MPVEPAVRLFALAHLDPSDRLETIAPAGSSIAEIVALALPGAAPEQRAMARVTIGDALIPVEAWSKVRPKPGVSVVVRLLPGNSGLLRNVLSITVAVAAMALGQFYVGPMLLGAGGLGLTGAALTAATSVATGVLGIAGALLVNSLVPIRNNNTSVGEANVPNYSVSGWRNALNPDAPVPAPLGRIRYAPPYAAQPYTEAVGDDNYVIALFCFGSGPLAISDLRIGDTPIGKYTEISYELREGWPGDAPVTLYPQQVLEERVSVELSRVHAATFGADSRWTAADATEVSIDITFPNGLAAFSEYSAYGNTYNIEGPWGVDVLIEQRLESSSAWETVTQWNIGHMTQRTFTRTFRWSLPTRGRYEIRVSRLSDDWDDWNQSAQSWKIISRSWWSACRSYRPEYPLNVDRPLAICAVKVKATRQLNGTLDNFNAVCSRICWDWDAPSQSWVFRETANPASLFRYVLQSGDFAYPLPDASIDLAGLQYWHGFCAARGLRYNRVHDFEAELYDVLADVAAAGRASPTDLGGKWSVVIDEIKSLVVAHISPRNSWSFSGKRQFVRFPDAFRVRFQDETSTFGFTEAEMVIPWPGFVGDPLVTEAIDLPGFTSPTLIWQEARRRQYELKYRRDDYFVEQDFESIVYRRGDLVRLSHDVLKRTQKSARVTAVNGAVVTLDDTVEMQAGTDYAVRFRKLAASDSADDISLLRTLRTVPGETDTLILTGTGAAPDVGCLALFGVAGQESAEAIVAAVEGGENLVRRVRLVDHAPQIQTLTDSEIPPPWNGRVGQPGGDPTVAPPVPIIGSVVSGIAAAPEPPIKVFAPLSPGSGGAATARYDLQHRLQGASSWTPIDVPVGSGGAFIIGYAKGDHIELRARAVGYGIVPLASAYTGVVSHVVAETDPEPIRVASFSVVELASHTWRFTFTLDRQPAGSGVRIKWREGPWELWSDLTGGQTTGVITASPWDSSVPEITTEQMFTFGVVALDPTGAESGAPILVTRPTHLAMSSLDFSDPLSSQYLHLIG